MGHSNLCREFQSACKMVGNLPQYKGTISDSPLLDLVKRDRELRYLVDDDTATEAHLLITEQAPKSGPVAWRM